LLVSLAIIHCCCLLWCLKSAYEPEGREFESLRARHIFNNFQSPHFPQTLDLPLIFRVLVPSKHPKRPAASIQI